MTTGNLQDAFTCGRMIIKLNRERSLTTVTQKFGIEKTVISRAWKAFERTGTAVKMGDRPFSGGRPREITASDARFIVLQVKLTGTRQNKQLFRSK